MGMIISLDIITPLFTLISLRYDVHVVLSHASQFAIRMSHRMCVTM